MKPFLGLDITEDKNNENFNGTEFIAARPSLAVSGALETSIDDAVDMVEKAKLPLALRIIYWVCGTVGLLIVVFLGKSITREDSAISELVEKNVSWLLLLGGACILVWLILHILKHKKAKSVIESDEGSYVVSKLDNMSNTVFTELGVPSNAQDVDILSFKYKIKDGMPKACAKGLETTPYTNLEYKIFTDSENLYFADLDGKYAFPLSSLRAIRTVNKRISVSEWNKEENPRKGKYKQFKLSIDDYGNVHFKPYHILELEYNGEIWGIYFPKYELPVFESLTGLTAEQ